MSAEAEKGFAPISVPPFTGGGSGEAQKLHVFPDPVDPEGRPFSGKRVAGQTTNDTHGETGLAAVDASCEEHRPWQEGPMQRGLSPKAVGRLVMEDRIIGDEV